jgi:hypothetical protein
MAYFAQLFLIHELLDESGLLSVLQQVFGRGRRHICHESHASEHAIGNNHVVLNAIVLKVNKVAWLCAVRHDHLYLGRRCCVILQD